MNANLVYKEIVDKNVVTLNSSNSTSSIVASSVIGDFVGAITTNNLINLTTVLPSSKIICVNKNQKY